MFVWPIFKWKLMLNSDSNKVSLSRAWQEILVVGMFSLPQIVVNQTIDFLGCAKRTFGMIVITHWIEEVVSSLKRAFSS
jgi:hypothetical protein